MGVANSEPAIWDGGGGRHDLETFQDSLKAFEDHAATTSAVLTESQLKAMEKAK